MIKLNYFLNTLIGVLLICSAFLSNAQTTVVDLTTGTAALTTPDPKWDVKTPGSNNFQNAIIVRPLYNYVTDGCGKWITPIWDQHAQKPDDALPGDYVYKIEFSLDLSGSGCVVMSAILDLPILAADNKLTGMTLNGNPITVPTNILHNQAGSIYQSVANFIQDGNNILEVTVDNWLNNNASPPANTPTALLLCGNITVVKECRPCYNEKPTNLSCSSNFLDWNDVVSSLGGYQVEVTWDDPQCCGGDGSSMFSTLIDVYTGESEHLLTSLHSSCFSWRVRALCEGLPCDEENWGPWSDPACSCPMGKTEWAIGDEDSNERSKTFLVYPNPGNGIFKVDFSGATSYKYSVMDINGRIIIDPVSATANTLMLDLTDNAPGVYFFKVQFADKVQVVKLVIQSIK